MKIKVRVTPNARKESFERKAEGQYAAAVKERAERNEANARVQHLIARHFNVPLTSVRFLTGQRSKSKLFEVAEALP